MSNRISTNRCAVDIAKQPTKHLTVGETMDEAIREAREKVERLCIRKVKLEAMNLLNHPYEELTNLFDRW